MTSQQTFRAHPPTDLAIVIPHFDDLARLRRCLTALAAQDCSGVDVIVADNATPGGLGSLPSDFPWLRFVTEHRKGAAAARNAGAAATTAPWIAFLDADCVPARNWLAKARGIADGKEDVVTGGRIRVFDETPPPRSGAEAFETVFAFNQDGYITRKGFSVTANLVTARSTFTAVGPFVVGVSEDLDWCHRATAAGYQLVYDPALCVSHPTRSDWPALRRKWRRTTAEGFGLVRHSLSGRAGWAMKALAMPLSVFLHLPRIFAHSELSWNEKLRAAGTLVRLRLARMVWMIEQSIGR